MEGRWEQTEIEYLLREMDIGDTIINSQGLLSYDGDGRFAHNMSLSSLSVPFETKGDLHSFQLLWHGKW